MYDSFHKNSELFNEYCLQRRYCYFERVCRPHIRAVFDVYAYTAAVKKSSENVNFFNTFLLVQF